MNRNKRKKFFRFLKEIGAYKSFLNRTEENPNNYHKQKNCLEYLKNSFDGRDAIINSFCWADTPEGDRFWSTAWIILCENNGNYVLDETVINEIKALNKSAA